jgi:hypothetical protein
MGAEPNPPEDPRPDTEVSVEIKTATLRDYVFRLENEQDRLRESVSRLRDALRDAIRDTKRVTRRTVEVDPAGNVYAYEWTDRVRAWADLCDLDLTGMDPFAYGSDD